MLITSTTDLAAIHQSMKLYQPDQTFLLYDQNTVKFCDTKIRSLFPHFNNSKRIIIPCGDENKTLEKCMVIWDALLAYNATKKAVLINVGGGMITDIGGYCAANYKRGIDFINIPTSLLGMVDASIGGKTAVNFRNSKNQIGLFNSPKCVYINPDFLNTLPRQELFGGIAEMLKHELLFNKNAIPTILRRFGHHDWIKEQTIIDNISYKKSVVEADFYDTGLRQCLNFGHTIGHAIEAYSHSIKTPILHGEAVILGMIDELQLSEVLLNCPEEIRLLLTEFKAKFYPLLDFKYTVAKILPFLLQDKKKDNSIRFSLLRNVAQPETQIAISIETIENVLA